MIPLGRAASVEEVSSAVCYLFKENASYMTGQVMTLSGGLL
jgi:NAD(P)-dependent dehydrogenase (short-subunit alcohol dehydrogenase family)